MSRRRSLLFVPLVVVTCSILGGIFGPEVVSAAAGPDDDIKASLQSFTKFYDVVEANFADPVEPDKAIYNGAIPGMLRTLDPHSNFFDPKAFALLKEEQRGHYYGVGMMVSSRNGKTVVVAPFGGSPAYKAGLRPGDIILEVNDKSTDKLNTTEVAELLKGPRNTHVQIKVQRDGIAYVKIEQFSETTSRELEDGLKSLGEDNIKGLVMDLRRNPGGLLNEGVEVAGHFLKKGDVVVSQRGRGAMEKPYVARRGNGGHDYPIVVLVNRYSASAAEIVAGALQDHDRAWIMGETTFGKGLVQTVYPLSENSGLALTTYHYYTPSGRLIQRDYSHTSFLDYYYHKNLDTRNPLDVKMTDSGRTVYGGGGITPDEKYETPKLNKFQTAVLRKDEFFKFTARYFGARESAKLPKGWAPDENVISEFHDYMLKDGVDFTEMEFTENHDWLKERLKQEMYITAFSKEQSDRVTAEDDPEVAAAVAAMPKAEALLQNAKKMMVQRINRQAGQ
jgi:carboxyl-terminal processing protease